MTDDTHNSGPEITRRSFVVGSAALTASALAAGAVLTGCKSSKIDTGDTTDHTTADSNDIEVLAVDETDVTSLSSFDIVDDPTNLYTEVASYKLPLGSIVWQVSDSLAVVLGTGETSSPLSQVKMLDLGSGVLTTVISAAVSAADGYEIYDVRASTTTIAWSEYDYMTSDWRLYASTLNGSATSIGEVYRLDDGDVNWDPPLICVVDDKVYWTRLPYEKGLYTSGSSYLRQSDAKGSDVWDVYTSPGRFATTPEVSDGILAFVPRLATDNVYYQLAALDTTSDDVTEKTTLPVSVKPMNALYISGAFSFCIEASYSSDSAIATMGTYRSLGAGKYFRVGKVPSCSPALCNGRFIVKYGKSTAVIDLDDRTYFTIPAPSYSWSYGDYLAISGSCRNFVVYSTVDTASDVNSAYVLARVISLN